MYELLYTRFIVNRFVDRLLLLESGGETVYFGEVGLSGEVRQVAQAEARLREAQKLGFAAAVLPRRLARGGRPAAALDGLRLTETGHLADLVAPFAERTVARREGPARPAAAKPA